MHIHPLQGPASEANLSMTGNGDSGDRIDFRLRTGQSGEPS